MKLFLILAGSWFLLAAAYRFYGGLIARRFNLRSDTQTPAHQMNDGIDFVPTNKYYLLGQHLSAIAAAGPIVGPVLAALWFGWLPTMLWILLGTILVGGVHDMTALVASLRHQAKSIAEVIRVYMSERTYKMFLFFLWMSLIYVITAFTDITAGTFAAPDTGSQVSSSSMLYLILALVMGIVMRYFRWPLWLSTLVFFPLIFVSIYLGKFFPFMLHPLGDMNLRETWNVVLIGYCFAAAVIPVWLLLQPRGYLGGVFLVVMIGISFLGLILGCFQGNFDIEYSAWVAPTVNSLPLFPVLFTTIACGACSGFHSIVASGTTVKQLDKETDTQFVGYGGMLLEAIVALGALATVMVLTPKTALQLKDPQLIYANGIASFLNVLHIPKSFSLNFALLAFATFIYDTLDVSTRLGRYLFEELTGVRNRLMPYLASITTLILPFFFVTVKMKDAAGKTVSAWQVFWSVFGASNQLLAGFVLFALSLWLFRTGKKYLFTLIPAFFMMGVAGVSLVLVMRPLIAANGFQFSILLILFSAGLLLFLGAWLVIEGLWIFWQYRKDRSKGAVPSPPP